MWISLRQSYQNVETLVVNDLLRKKSNLIHYHVPIDTFDLGHRKSLEVK